LREDCSLFDLLAVANVEEGTDNDVVVFHLFVVRIDDLDRSSLVQHDCRALGGFNKTEALVLHGAAGADANFRSLESARCDTTDVEGAHGELRSRFTDRLRGDDTDGIADLRHFARGWIDAVALRVDAVLADRREGRHDLDPLDANFIDLGGHLLRDELAGTDENL
jgi:hypothetical protein